MTTLVESALDLSSKPGVPECGSPAPSLSPEPASLRHPGSHTPDRLSDSDGSHSTPSSTMKTPVSSPSAGLTSPNMGYNQPQFPATMAQLAGAMSAMTGAGFPAMSPSPSTPEDSKNDISSRPFKMYPFEGMNPAMYTQMAAAAAAAASGTPGLSPFGSQPSMPFGLFDSGISLTSPIGQYLQSRKRRADSSRQSSHATSPGQQQPQSHSEEQEKRMRLSEDDQLPSSLQEKRDESYWERRRKNNEAAKRSRDSRRAKEEEIALRAAYLEQENLKLRAQVAILKNETAKLHYMLYNRM